MNKTKEKRRSDTENGGAENGRSERRAEEMRAPKYGAILAFLFTISAGISRMLKSGFFGNLFITLYAGLNEKWKSGYLYRALTGRTRVRDHSELLKTGKDGESSENKIKKKFKARLRSRSKTRRRVKVNGMRFRVRFARLYEESLLGAVISGISSAVIHSFIRIWGLALFSYGFVMIFVAMVKYFFTSEITYLNILIGIVMCVISVPLMISKKRLGEALLGGRLSSFVMTKVLSLDVAKFEEDDRRFGGSYGVTFAISAVLGLLTYSLSPLLLIGAFLLVAAFVIIMCFPELGITSVLAIIPFSNVFEHPSLAMFVLIIFSFLGFFSKYIRGKRVFKLELIDLMVLVFTSLILLGGVFTAGGIESTRSALMYTGFMLMYFLVVNSYIRKTWIYRGIKLVVISTSIVSIIGVFEDGVVSSSWVDMSAFSDIGARISSFLGNPNMLGAYLVMVFPLVLSQMLVSDRGRSKLFYAMGALSVAVCTVMTWSRGAWLGMMVTMLLFLVLYNFKNIWLIVAGLVTSPLWFTLLPESIVKRFLSILTMTDTSIIYRFNTWRGVLRMIKDNILGGIGVGESAFKNVYSLYAVSGTETVMHSHNLFLEITLSLGIVGIAVFLLILVMYAQKCLADIATRRIDSKSRIMISAGLSGIAGALVMGLTDHIWYNYRVFLIFWSVIALTVALIKINENEKAKEIARSVGNQEHADLDIYC